jgi:hypothetical protein
MQTAVSLVSLTKEQKMSKKSILMMGLFLRRRAMRTVHDHKTAEMNGMIVPAAS